MKDDNIATIHKDDLSLVDENRLNEKQLNVLLRKTPKKYVKQRPAKGGGQWDYVSGGYVKKCLNLMFGWDWDFEIMDEKIMIESKEVVVKGRLTCRSNGSKIVKMQYGNKDIMFRRNSEIPLSIGNDMKAAATDALKKCASELGIAADVYNSEEFREINVVSQKFTLDELKKEFSTLDQNDISPEDVMNIERIIEQEEKESYKKVILLIQKAKQ